MIYLNALWKVNSSYGKKEVSDEKKSCSLKIKVSEVLLCFKDKESNENVCFVKIKLLMKVQVYVKRLSDICSLWNFKFYDLESYTIL